jgi:hypothetical protein
MKESAKRLETEKRWPVIVAILLSLLLLSGLPERIRLLPYWTSYLTVIVVLLPMTIVSVVHENVLWLKVERIVTFLFCFTVAITNIINLSNLVHLMIDRSKEVDGLQLLMSGLGSWVINLLAFSLLYWLIDRGGPNIRPQAVRIKPDWLFPQESAPAEKVPAGWRPVFIDYLFLSYCTSTAFSPTDVLPLTSRGKMLVLLESAISLATILVVMSRAINILGN